MKTKQIFQSLHFNVAPSNPLVAWFSNDNNKMRARRNDGKTVLFAKIGSLRNRTAGRLTTAEWRKMSRKIGNAQSRATFFLHSAVLSVPAVLLRNVYFQPTFWLSQLSLLLKFPNCSISYDVTMAAILPYQTNPFWIESCLKKETWRWERGHPYTFATCAVTNRCSAKMYCFVSKGSPSLFSSASS